MKWCLQSTQFKNHLLLWPTQDCLPGMPTVEFSEEEIEQVWDWMGAMTATQLYLQALPEDANGQYLLEHWPVLDKDLLWPTEIDGPGLKKVSIGPAKYAKVKAAFDGIDAMQTLIRSKMVPSEDRLEDG